MKKLMQKLGSLILIAAMVLSLAVPVMADEPTELAVPPTVTEMEWSNINAWQPQGAGVKGWNAWADSSRAFAPYCNSITSTQVNGEDAELSGATNNVGIIIGADYLTIGRNYAVFTAEGYENMMLVFDYAVDADGNKTVTFVEQKFGAEAYYVPAVVKPTIFFTGDQKGETSRFLTSATVEITESTEGAEVYYTTDGTVPTKDSTLYTGPFTVTEGCTIQAKAFLGEDESTVAKFTCSVIPNSELPGSYKAEAALSSLMFQADQNNSDIAAVIEDTADATVIKNEDGSYTYEVTLTASEGTATGSFASYHGNGVITGQDLESMQYRPASNNWNEPEAEIVYDNPLAGIRKFKATFLEVPRGLLVKFKLHDNYQMPTGNLWLKPDSFTAETGEADPAELEKTIAGAKKADLAYLEEETVSAWNQAIAEAEKVLDDMEAAQAEMDAAVANILSIYADITAQKGEGYALVNIPYDAFYRAEVGENGVDTVSGATVAKSRNYALAAGSWHAAEGKAAEGATYAVKVSDLAQLKAAAKAKGGAEITDASALSYEVSGKNGTSTTELKGAEVLFESPAYSYYLLAEEPAAYKELVITEEAFAFGEATAAAAGEAEVALDLSDRHADYTLKVTTNDFDDKDVSAAVITAGDKKYGLCAISNIWRKTELGWNSDGDYADIAGKTITNITYYTVKGNYSYDVEIAVPPYCDAVTAEFTGSKELTLQGIPADAENVKVTAYTDLKKKTGSLTGQEAAAVGTDGVAELSAEPEEDTEYVLTVTADNYKFAYVYLRSPKAPAVIRTFAAGEYEIAQSLRKATDTASESMASPVFGKTAKVVVDKAGKPTVTISFQPEAKIMGFTCHPVGIDIYDAAGEKVEVTYETTTVSNLYNKATGSNDTEGEALVKATFTLPYIADDGIYQGKIYSDFMDSEVAVWLDLDGIKTVVADGVYTVPVTIYKYSNPQDTSMANEALDGDVIVRVKDGAATYDMTYKGIVVGAYKGHLTNLFSYAAEDSALQNPLEAAVTETFEDTGLNGENETFARTFALAGGEAGLDTIYIRVRVDVMEQIAKDNNKDYVLGDGEQIAIMTIDWDSAEVWTETEAAAYEEKMAAAEATAAVNQAIEAASAIDTNNYTDDSVAALNKAIEAAKALGPDATEAQKNAAAKAIAEALANLTPYPDAGVIASRSSLTALVAEVNSMTSAGYTKDSFAALQNAVKEAKAVLAQDKASAESMKTAQDSLNKALKALKKTLSKASLSKTKYAWTGKNLKPGVTVKDTFGATLKAGTDYTVAYKNNKAVGVAKVTITGKGSYAGTITKTFKINPAKAAIKTVKVQKGKKLTVSLKKAAKKYGASKFQIRYRVKGTSKWKKLTVTKQKATLKKLKAGKKYQIQVRTVKKVKGKTYYGAWSKVKTSKKVKK